MIFGTTVLMGLGVVAAAAVAGGKNTVDHTTSTGTTSSTTGTTASTTTTTSTTTEGTTTSGESGNKLWLCRRTHSKKHPFVRIHVSQNAASVHLSHGDTAADVGTNCASGTTTTTTATTTSMTTTTGHGHGHGHGRGGSDTQGADQNSGDKSGRAHGNHGDHANKH
jgi:hypothetical protein